VQPIVRAGPLTWGQHLFWYWNNPWNQDAHRPVPLLSLRLTVPEDTTTARLRESLRECADMFEALRTVFPKPGLTAPEQRVLERYEPPVLDADEAGGVPFDITQRPSLRCVVQRAGDRITRADLVANAIDLDGFSIATVRRLVEHRAVHGQWPEDFDPATNPATRTHPIDCALQESSRYARLSERALRWTSELRRGMPRNILAAVRDPAAPATTCVTTLQHPQLLVDVERLAEREEVSPATVLHAVIAVVFAGWADRPDAYLTTAVANRSRPDARHVIGRVASVVGCRIPVDPEQTVSALLRRTNQLLFRAYWHGSRDFGADRMAGVREDAAYGSLRSGMVLVEYLTFLRDDPGRQHTVLAHDVQTETRPGGFPDIRVDIAPLWPGIRIAITADSAILAPAQSARILALLADLVQLAARQPEATVDGLLREVTVRSPADKVDWLRFGESRFAAEAIRALLLGYDGVAQAAVFTGGEEPLRAYVAGAGVDLAGLHEHMLAGASADPLVRVPTAYRSRGDAPAEPGLEPSWERGAGQAFLPRRDYRARVDGDERVGALMAAFGDCHPGNPGDPSRSYAESGGRYLMIPAMMVRLRSAGYEGAEPADFLGLAPLAAVARRLRRVP
jgi:condensation domain-containing protein